MLGFIVIFVLGLVLGSPWIIYGAIIYPNGKEAREKALGAWTFVGLVAFVGGILASL